MSAFSAEVSFPAYGVSEQHVTDLRVVQEEYRHDIAVFTVHGVTATRRQYRTDTPVHVTWSQGREKASFIGVVHHTEADPHPGSSSVKVWCKGASEAFDNGGQKVWVTRTATSVLAELARSFGFDADIVSHGQVFNSQSLAGGRTWEFMVERAREIGFSLYVKNTRLMVHPRTHLTQKYAGQAPVLRLGEMGDRGSLYTFAPVDGATPPGSFRTTHTLSGVDARTGTSFAVRGGPADTKLGRSQYLAKGERFSNVDVHTPSDGRWKLQAMAENTRFNLTASALAAGFPRVHQTWPVMLANVEAPYVGLWFVKKVTHILTDLNYLMELELGRDGHVATVPVPDPRARRVVATRATPGGKAKAVYPPTVLVNGQWRSQWSASSRTFKGG